VEPTDPRKFDWPIPEPDSAEELALSADESLQKAAEGLRQDLARLPQPLGGAFAELIADCFEHSPAPSESVYAIERMFATHATLVPEFVQASLLSPRAFRRLFVLLGHSRLIGRFLLHHGWRRFLSLSEEQLAVPVTAAVVADATRERVAAGEDARAALRLAHHEFAARVLYRETALQRPVEETGAEISALADAALQVALEQARNELARRRGLQPPTGFRFCVIALGKLGASELNYSSDIDLMFVHSGARASSPHVSSEAPALQAYAMRLAEALIPLLDEVTEHGRVFRVDTRLRPEGSRGHLSRSLQSALDYYFSFGSTLERQAMIKARAAAGDLDLGRELIARLQPWVYRKYLTVEEINQIQSLKRRIEERTGRRDETFVDVKAGFGGIRDIEFVTQFLQLLNGGRMEAVRRPATLDALDALARNGVLSPREALELADAYRFLRKVEHRLQLWEGAQTHALPADPAALARVGRAMGLRGERHMDPARRLIKQLQSHTLKSRGLMVRLFAGLFDAHAAPEESELVLDEEIALERAAAILSRYEFRDADAAFRLIRDLAEETPENRLYAPRARKYLASMMPALLEFCRTSADADFTLRNFERICSNLGAKTMLFELVAEDPRALAVFGSIAAQSQWLTDILARRPGLVDEFIDQLQTFTALDRATLRQDLAARLEFASDFNDALFWQRDVELLRIGLFDITGRTPVPETLRELSVLAEVLLEFCVGRALELEFKGQSSESDNSMTSDNLAVIAMGKLGSRAMNYASDLDLVFAYDPAGFDDASAAQAFYNRVARRARDLLGQSGERGRLYEVDLRLRPRGGAGSVAVSLPELERYLRQEAGYWERIAATRARVLDTSTAAGRRAQELLDEFAFGTPVEAGSMRQMRDRLASESARNALKRGEGGTLDIEFLLAHLQMRHGLRQPVMWEALDELQQAGHISAAEHDAIAGSYAYLRQVVNRLQLLDGVSRHELPQGEELEAFARRMGYAPGMHSPASQLMEELDWHRRCARELYNRFVDA
jgi:[glutamine synthetase] adenylyltransferase / [glutamine synthetase]-adenylyl-L-tyrosine phosphorylase